MIVGCDGVPVPVGTPLPQVDVCNVCQGNGTSCLGCDGKPFGATVDRCGVCAGDGSSCYNVCPYEKCSDCALAENCQWCESDASCIPKDEKSRQDKDKNKDCGDPITNPDDCGGLFGDIPTEAVGIGGGILAAIIIGAVAGAVLIGLGGKKGFDAWQANKNNMSGSQSNPMYKDDHLKGQNPFYSTEMKSV